MARRSGSAAANAVDLPEVEQNELDELFGHMAKDDYY